MKQQQPEQQPATVDLDDDDRPVGRVLSRREVLALVGGGSALFLGAMNALAAENVYLPIVRNDVTPTATIVPTAVTATPTATATTGATPTVTATSALTPTPSPQRFVLCVRK